VRRKHIALIASCLMATSMLGVVSISAKNADKALPTAGIAAVLDSYNYETEDKETELKTIVYNNVKAVEEEQTEVKDTDSTDAEKKEETSETETADLEETEENDNSSIYDSIAISQVDNYVNVRSEANTEAEVVGKIFDKCAATIEGEDGDWYKITSGNVIGYVNKSYFVTGEEAKAIAMECGYVNAKVTTTTLNVREGQGTNDQILTQIPIDEVYDVEEYGDGWVLLNIDEDVKGWVSEEFVEISVDYDTALTLEEEQAKLEEEERLRKEAEEAERIAEEAKKAQEEAEAAAAAQKKAAQAAANSQTTTQTTQTTQSTAQTTTQEISQATEETTTQTATSYDSNSDLRNAVVAYAMQFKGNPYVYGGSSLTNGTDCSGFTMSVYAHFGYSLPHSSGSQSGCGTRVSTSDLLPGDLLFYTNGGSSIGHVALYIGNGQIIHASTERTGITVSNAFYRTPACAVRIIN